MADSRAQLLEDAQWLWVSYHDYAGLARGKAVPRHQIPAVMESGLTFAMANWDIAVNDHQVPDPLFAADSGDFHVIPDPETLISLPGRPGVVHALSWLHEAGRPWDGDPRARLAAQVRRFASLGLRVLVSFESEFVLLERSADGGLVPAKSGPMFTTGDLDDRWPLFARALNRIESAGIHIHQFGKEYGSAQFEISLLPLPPVEATDAFLLTRQLLKAAVRDAGYVATFMPKPDAALAGNGLHVHLSLWDVSGREVIGDALDAARISELGEYGIAGLLEHAPALTALGAATPNSFRRLLPGSWAPAHIAWGFGNRAAVLRVPGTGAARRYEYRSGDASSNPYLYLAGILAAVADGIDRRQQPPPEVLGDIGRWSDDQAAARGIARLPESLPAALDALLRDPVVLDAIGPVIGPHYIGVKRFEQASFEEGGGRSDTVSEYELATYREAL